VLEARADDGTTRCLICLDNPDDYAAPGKERGMCYKCGTSFCSQCRPLLEQKLRRCPNCRAALFVPLSVSVARLKALIETRPIGRHVAPSLNNLGYLHERGLGVDADAAAAVAYYREAADRGLAAAQYNCGQAYERGAGVPRDTRAAAEWYEKAGAQGDACAKKALAALRRSDGLLARLARRLPGATRRRRRRRLPSRVATGTPIAHRSAPPPPTWDKRVASAICAIARAR